MAIVLSTDEYLSGNLQSTIDDLLNFIFFELVQKFEFCHIFHMQSQEIRQETEK